MSQWSAASAQLKYGESIGAAERVHPGISAGKNKLKETYEKWDTALSRGSLIHASDATHLFPARYYTKSEEEKNWQLQTEATVALGQQIQGRAPNVHLQTAVPDKYVQWIEAKQKAEFYMGFDKWIEDAFLDGDLAKRQFIKQSYPEYFEAREAEVKAKQELDKKVFDLKLHGAQDGDDLRFEYLLRTGAIQPDPTPIWDSSAGGRAGDVLERGFLSTHKWLLSTPYTGINAGQKTPFAAKGLTDPIFISDTATSPVGASVFNMNGLGTGSIRSNFDRP